MSSDDSILERLGSAKDSIFAIHGDLDGEKDSEFQEREQFIGLVIATESFMLPIAVVREIIMLPPITFVPYSPAFIDGVINLRGSILPALNMRKMMGFPRREPLTSGRAASNSGARIIIVQSDSITFGLIVDGITYVVALLPSEIETQTLPGKGTGAEFIGSIAKPGAKVCGVLDLARILKFTGANATEDEADEQEAA